MKPTHKVIRKADILVDQDAGLLEHPHHKEHFDLIALKCEKAFS